MLSIKKMSAGSEEYYLRLLRYFLRGGGDDDPDEEDDEPGLGGLPDPDSLDLPGEPAGIWMGTGAERLGLSGIVEPDALRRLMQGIHPFTEEPLVQNAQTENRCPGWDLTFSSPKSFGVVWSQAPPWMRQELEGMQRHAVGEAIRIAEQLTYSRVGKAGIGHVPIGLVVAAFEHGTSRSLDQELHTHCLVLNLGVDAEGKTRTIASRPLFMNKLLLGSYYRAMLAHQLKRDFGFSIRRDGTSFAIDGVPQKLVDACSQRRAQLLKQLREKGLSGGKAAAIAALDTRAAKGAVPSRNELFATWQARNAAHGFTAQTLENLQRKPLEWTLEDLAQAIEAATENLSKAQSHFSELDFLREVLQEAPARGLPPDPLLRLAQRVLEKGTDRIVPLGVHDGLRRYTTPEVLAEERILLETANALKSQTGAQVAARLVERAIRRQTKKLAKASKSRSVPQVSPEQRAAIDHLTNDTLGTGAIRILQGLAGTGKTKFVLAVAHRAWTDAGYKVLAATPTAKAARVLQDDSDIESRTIALFLGRYKSSLRRQILHDLRQYKRALRKRRTYPFKTPAPVKIDARTILVVDEAGMVTTGDTLDLMRRVQKAGGTIVLTGDKAQLPPIGRGAPFQSLSQRLGAVELVDIKRQNTAWAREVALHASRGEVQQALTLLAEHNAIRVQDTVQNVMKDLVQDWKAAGLANPKDIAVLANTNEETETLNQLCQAERLQAGALVAGLWMKITDHDAERDIRYEQRVYPGDRVIFTHNDKRLGVENGSLGTVIAMRPLLGNLAVQLDTGKTVLVSPKSFPHIRLGYAMTTYKAQGETYPHVQVLVTQADQTVPAFYVQVTRAKGPTTIYTPKSLWNPKEGPIADSALAASVARAPDLRLASDLLDGNATPPPHEPASAAELCRKIPPQKPAAQPSREQTNSNAPSPQATSPHAAKPKATTPHIPKGAPQPHARPSPLSPMARSPAVPYPLPMHFLAGSGLAARTLPSLPNPTFAAQASASSPSAATASRTTTNDQLQGAIIKAAAENNVPPDRIEVINQREWDERLGNTIRHWIEITFRIIKFLPRDLMAALLQFRRTTLTETWHERSQQIAASYLPTDGAAYMANAVGSGRGVSVFFGDSQTARDAIQSALTTHAPAIEAWLKNGACQRLRLDSNAETEVGAGFRHDRAKDITPATSLRVVLQKHPEQDGAFTVWTAHPLLGSSPQRSTPAPASPSTLTETLRYFFETYLTVPAPFENCDAVPQAVVDFRQNEAPDMLRRLAAAVHSADASANVASWFNELQLQHTLASHYSNRPSELLSYVGKCLRDLQA